MNIEGETDKVVNSMQQTANEAKESWKSMTAGLDERTRGFIKSAAGSAKERATDLYASAEKVNGAIHSALSGSIEETAKVTKEVQLAVYNDAEAFFANFDKLASAKTFGEAYQVHADYLRERGETVVARAKATSEYVGKLLANGAKTLQDNISKVTPFQRNAA